MLNSCSLSRNNLSLQNDSKIANKAEGESELSWEEKIVCSIFLWNLFFELTITIKGRRYILVFYLQALFYQSNRRRQRAIVMQPPIRQTGECMPSRELNSSLSLFCVLSQLTLSCFLHNSFMQRLIGNAMNILQLNQSLLVQQAKTDNKCKPNVIELGQKRAFQ